ncbi:hypothetical protein ANAEL_00785 [Anaerolineales bacterium]|nr:hypothetical protein ANAEL_00785 [Anaerolineales bacterium]
MGFFGKILEKLGLKKDAPAATAAAPAKPAASAKPITGTWTGTGTTKPAAKPTLNYEPTSSAPVKPAAPVAISEVDVVKQLEKLSAGKNLDWKVSIVDLLKLLDIDSSREARNELAAELGCPADLMKDSAKMNVWLHKEVLRQIAANGGNIPKSLLD